MKFQVGDIVRPGGIPDWVEVLQDYVPGEKTLCTYPFHRIGCEVAFWLNGAELMDPLLASVMKASYRKETHAKV